MFNAFLYGGPNGFQKISILSQLGVLSEAPQDGGALVFLLSPGRRGRPFNMVSLIPSTVRLLNFFAPTIEGLCIFVLAAAVERTCDICPASGPNVTVIWLYHRG